MHGGGRGSGKRERENGNATPICDSKTRNSDKAHIYCNCNNRIICMFGGI